MQSLTSDHDEQFHNLHWHNLLSIPLPTILLFPIPTCLHQYQYIDWSEDHCPINAAAVVDLIGVLQKTQLQLGGGVDSTNYVGYAGCLQL